jgi:transposase-like protein
MKKQRKHHTPEEKVAILRRHLLDKGPISKLYDELGLQPTVFRPCRWKMRGVWCRATSSITTTSG